VEMKRVAQDGMRVRASASAPSFRREKTLREHLSEAEAQVKALRAALEGDPAECTRRQQAARLRAAEDRRARLEQALSTMPTVRATKQRKRDQSGPGDPEPPTTTSDEEKKGAPRVSSTDPEARVMKMADGGFRPAYNAHFATDVETQVIVGLEVLSVGNDYGTMAPMLDQLEQRHGRVPEEHLADGGFAKLEDIEEMAVRHRCRVYAPTMKDPRPLKRKRRDSAAIADWRERMQTEEARRIYRRRAIAEGINAHCRNRGLTRLLVRGVRKVRSVLLLHALAHNLRRANALRQATV
jgi:hypothetical protein